MLGLETFQISEKIPNIIYRIVRVKFLCLLEHIFEKKLRY
jgi:hypothetical protein